MLQLAQMKREGGRVQAEPLADMPDSAPFALGLHQHPKDIETGLLRERGQGRYGAHFFHISRIV